MNWRTLFSTYSMLDNVQVLHSHHLSQFLYNSSIHTYPTLWVKKNLRPASLPKIYYLSSKWWSWSSMSSRPHALALSQYPSTISTGDVSAHKTDLIINLIPGPNPSMIIAYIIHESFAQVHMCPKAKSCYDICLWGFVLQSLLRFLYLIPIAFLFFLNILSVIPISLFLASLYYLEKLHSDTYPWQ